MYNIGVIIPFYGGEKYLEKLLESITVEGNKCCLSIIIVDNSRKLERIEPQYLNDNRIILIEAETGIGFGKACNIGYEMCKHLGFEIIVVLNQDGYFSSGSLDNLLDTLVSNPEISVVVPLLKNYHNDGFEEFYLKYYLVDSCNLLIGLLNNEKKRYYSVNKFWGTCFAMRLIDYKDFDYLFDDLFYMYFEDEDLMNRFNKLKLQVCLVPSAGFHHYHSHVQNIVRDDLKMQIVKRVSSHIFSFKSSYKNVLSQLPGWLLLELRICLSNFILLNWRNSIVEVLSVVKFFPFLFRVHKRKLNEKIIFQNLL